MTPLSNQFGIKSQGQKVIDPLLRHLVGSLADFSFLCAVSATSASRR